MIMLSGRNNEFNLKDGSLTAALLVSVKQALLPDWTVASAQAWSLALAELVDKVTLHELLHCARLVSEQFAEDRHAAFIVSLTKQALLQQPATVYQERDGQDFLPFVVPSSQVAILVFCGGSHRVGFPLSIAHQWFGSLQATVIYLFDESKTFYFNGLTSVAGGFEETVSFIKQQLTALGIKAVYCYGSSLGSYAAIRFGLALQAKAVLCFAGPTNLTADFLIEQQIYIKRLPLMLTESANALDLRQALLQAPTPPQVTLFYGERNLTDKVQAENLAGLAHVRLVPVSEVSEHNVVREVILSNQWQAELLAWRACT